MQDNEKDKRRNVKSKRKRAVSVEVGKERLQSFTPSTQKEMHRYCVFVDVLSSNCVCLVVRFFIEWQWLVSGPESIVRQFGCMAL